MILTIFRKDLIDAIRDGRVAIALVIPILIGVSYAYLFDDDLTEATPTYTVAVAAADTSAIADQLAALAGSSIDLTIERPADEAAVRDLVQDGDADLGIVVPAGFDAAIAAGQQPALTVLAPPETTAGTSWLLAALDPALRSMAGQDPPAQITLSATDAGEETLIERIGLRTYMLMFSMIFLVGMIAVFAIPIILTEEIEKRTLDALVMIASYGDVMIGKALVGLVYIAVATVVTLSLASAEPGNIGVFALGIAALSVALLGFGLFIGGLFRNANQLNTWGSLLLFPLIAPAFLVPFPIPDWADVLVSAFPTGAAAKVIIDGLTGEALFGNVALYVGIMLAWAVLGFMVLGWQLRRRQA
jgi:ABC-2 type transport system permease protein